MASARQWTESIRAAGIKSIISFMHDRDLRCYSDLEIEGADLLEYFEREGLVVARIPWEDPAQTRSNQKAKQEKLETCCAAALVAFDRLPKPVMLQCSAGIDRTAPAAAYIWGFRSAV